MMYLQKWCDKVLTTFRNISISYRDSCLQKVKTTKEILYAMKYTLFYKQLGPGFSPQSCLYFQGLWDSVVWPMSAKNTVIFKTQNGYIYDQ